MKYLLDELVRYEYGFADMLNPDRRPFRHTIFMGEEQASHATDQQQHQQQQQQLHTLEKCLSVQSEQLIARFDLRLAAMEQRLLQQMQRSPDSNIGQRGESNGGGERERRVSNGGGHEGSGDESAVVNEALVVSESIEVETIPQARTVAEVVAQWTTGDPKKNLHVPLKEWTAAMRNRDEKTAVKYAGRKKIASEHIRLGEALFNERYGYRVVNGKPNMTLKALLREIPSRNEEGEVIDVPSSSTRKRGRPRGSSLNKRRKVTEKPIASFFSCE